LKILKSFLLLLLISCLLLFPPVFSYPPLEITVNTDKPSYNTGERVEIYGEVTLDSDPVENAMVALEVRDPSATPILTRTAETNSSGMYSVSFILTSENQLGTYSVHVSCNHDGEEATNSSSFNLEHISILELTVETNSDTYEPAETVIISGIVTYDNSPVKGVLVAVEVQDPEGTAIAVRVLETEEQGDYLLTLQLSPEFERGEYKVYASASYEDRKAKAYTTFKLETHLLTDINGDGTVNIIDLASVAMAWGTRPGDPRWDPKCDIDENGLVNIIDLTLVALDWGKKV